MIELFGGMNVRAGDQTIIHFRTQKTAALLAFLALHLKTRHAREELVDRFWPDVDLEAGRSSLRTALAALRRQLEPEAGEDGDLLVTDRLYVQLNAACVTTDVGQFEKELLLATRTEDNAERIGALSRAVALYRGPLLPGFYDTWVLQERERLNTVLLRALRELVAALQQAGQLDRALEVAHRAVQLDPLQEESHVDLMRLYTLTGQPAAVKRQYQELEKVLRQELDAMPAAETQEVYRQLLKQRSIAPASPLAKALSDPQANVLATSLPAPLTRFFGREEEIEQIIDLLAMPGAKMTAVGKVGSRLVTLTGPGGSGKTRLAIEAGRRIAAVDEVAVCFVPLADIAQAAILPATILHALKMTPRTDGDTRQQLYESLVDQPYLLILDNFEQLVEEGTEDVRALLEQVPTLCCLVTSRQRLDLGGEREFAVQPLPVPSIPGSPEHLEKFPSVQLFVDRAQAARPDFEITRENASVISALCEQLDGIPLALELAAAWMQILTPSQILARLSQRFHLLTSRRKDLPLRHRTLRSAIEWSYQSLDPELQRFFAQLAVFRGGWTLEAAEAVCGEPFAIEYLNQLRERSLIQAEEAGGEMRFRMLETLREYAAEQLAKDEESTLAQRHAAYFLRLIQELRARQLGPEQATVLDRVEREHDNYRAALQWSLAEESGTVAGGVLALELCSALYWFWDVRGYVGEARNWHRQALAAAADAAPPKTLAAALYSMGRLAMAQHDVEEAEATFTPCLSLMRELKDQAGIVNTTCMLGLVQYARRAYEAAEKLFYEALALARALRDQGGEAHLLKCLGMVHRDRGELSQAEELCAQSLQLYQQLGNLHGISMMLGETGHLALMVGDYDRAERVLLEHLELSKQLKAISHVASALNMLGLTARHREDWSLAASYYRQSLPLRRELGELWGISHQYLLLADIALKQNELSAARSYIQAGFEICGRRLDDVAGMAQCLAYAGTLAVKQEKYCVAAELFGAAEILWPPICAAPPASHPDYANYREISARALGAEEFMQHLATGKSLSLKEARQLLQSFLN